MAPAAATVEEAPISFKVLSSGAEQEIRKANCLRSRETLRLFKCPNEM